MPARRLLAGLLLLPVTMPALALDDPPPVEWPQLPGHVADLATLPPPLWRLESRDDGDLDRDGRADAVLVLKMVDERNLLANDILGPPLFDTNPRLLVVALADPAGGWRLVAQDHALIPRPWSPTSDDYLEGEDAVAITARGALTVKLHQWSSAGSWSAGSITYTFRYEGGCLRLIGYDSDQFHRATMEQNLLSINYLTGRVKTVLVSGEDEGGEEYESWEKFATRRLCLADIGDGLEFQPNPAAGP